MMKCAGILGRFGLVLIALLLLGSQQVAAITQDDATCVVNSDCFYDPLCATSEVGTPAPGATLPASATEAQKIAQTFTVGFDASTPKAVITDIAKKFSIGGIYLTGTADAQAAGFTPQFFTSLNTAAGTPLTIASDEEGGEVTRFAYPDITGGFPSAKQMGAMTDTQVEQLAGVVANDLKNDGVTMDLAPVLDLDDGNNIISKADRSFSSDPNTVAEKAGAFTEGMESDINVTFKHFPGFGGAGAGDTDTEPVTVPSTYDLTDNVIPYKTLIAQHPTAAIMLSNLIVPQLSGNQPTSISTGAVNYLRSNLNFVGLITTDDLSALSQPGYVSAGKSVDLPKAVSDALNAGVDMPLFGIDTKDQATAENKIQAVINSVEANVAPGIVDNADTAVLASKNNITDATAPTSCCPGGSTPGTTLSGNGNGVKAYNYFVTTAGLSPAAASGIVGNMTEESIGVEPERLQGDFTGRVPAESLSPDEINQAGLGWGIVQWTPPSSIIGPADNNNTPLSTVDTLTYQVTYVWKELTSNPSYYLLPQLKAATTPEQAADIFLAGFERGDPSPTREAYARDYYNLATKNIPLPPNVPVSFSDGGGPGPSTSSSGGGCPNTPTPGGVDGYTNPWHDMTHLGTSRIDEGVDYYADPGTTVPYYAIGTGVVTQVASGDSSFYPLLPNWITYQLTGTGLPAYHKYIYIAEACPPLVHVAEPVTSNTELCAAQPASIETGWAYNGTLQFAAAGPVYKEGYETAYGVNFNQLLTKLGAPGGHLDALYDPSGQVLGTLPYGWPNW